jgi:hypothetical protein
MTIAPYTVNRIYLSLTLCRATIQKSAPSQVAIKLATILALLHKEIKKLK